MSEVEFVDKLPPGIGAWDSFSRREAEHFAEALRANPGRWAVHPGGPRNESAARALSSRINRGKIAAFAEGFEAAARQGTVYVRFLKEDQR